MRSVFLPCRHRAVHPATMRATVALAFAVMAFVALGLALAAGNARAEMSPAERFLAQASPAQAAPAALSRPAEIEAQGVTGWQSAAFRGLSCSRCNSATQFCVLNPVRYEYACAPLGTVACISASRTHWCPAGRGCWAGRCR